MRQLLLTLILTILCIASSAQSIFVYKTESLPSTLFTDVVEDNSGYIWIGTEYGLTRFDGVRFFNFYANDKNFGLVNGYIRRLYIDNTQRLWVATNGGLQYWDSKTHKFHTVTDESGNYVVVAAITETPKGLIFLKLDGKVLQYDSKKDLLVTPKDINKKLSLDSGSSLYTDKSGIVWIGTLGEGIVKYDIRKNEVKRYSDAPVEMSNLVVGFYEGQKGVYAVMGMTVALYDAKSDIFVKLAAENSYANYRSISHSKKDFGILGTFGFGMQYIDENTQTVREYPLPEHMDFRSNTANVTAFIRDRRGDWVIGAFDNGVGVISSHSRMFSSKQTSQLPTENGKSLSLVKSINNTLWVGQDRNGLWKIDEEGNFLGHFIEGQTPLSVVQASDGKMYVGLYDYGLAIVNPTTGAWTLQPEVGYTRVKALVEHDGILYIGIFNKGVYALNLSSGELKQLPEYSVNKAVNCLALDGKGNLWIGTYLGVYCYNIKSGTYIDTPRNQALHSICYQIIEGKNGVMWFATSTGLFSFDKKSKKVKQITTEQGLSNDVVCAVEEDANGIIWCSTYKGINRYNPKDGKISTYETGNGLSEVSYMRGISTVLPNGHILFANNRQIVEFDPKRVMQHEDSKLPCPTLTAICVYSNNEEEYILGEDASKQALRYSFSSSKNTFKLDFSAFDIDIANSCHLEYRINKKDVWTPVPGNQWSLTLAGLSSGSHDIEVRIVSDDAVSEVLTFKIVVDDPWYWTWWTKLFYLTCLVVAVTYIFISYRRRYLYRENEARLRFFMDVAHEFRSPITLILSPLQDMMKNNPEAASSRTLQYVYYNANRLLLLVNQILDIRKLDKGKMQSRFIKTDIVPFVENVTRVFEYEAKKDNIVLTFSSNVAELDVWVDRNHLEKIIYNLLSNAFKYSSENGDVTVEVESDGTDAIIIVSDRGKGVPTDQMPLIFDRYYRIPGDKARRGSSSGIGLNLCRQLVEIHKGTITVSNKPEPDHGAVFTVRLPLGKKHLPAVDLVKDADAEEVPSPVLVPSVEVLMNRQAKLKSTIKRTSNRIVIVDDDDDLREYLCTELHPYYHVSAYSNGREALTKIIDEVPDLVISDVVMPEMDGLEMLRRLKNNNVTSHIPVIMLSSETGGDSHVAGFSKGADAYLDKPFSLKELLSAVDSLLANRRRVKGKLTGAQDQVERTVNVQMKNANDELMEAIMNHLNNNISNPDLNIEKLASEVGLSRSQLYRRVKEITGISCGEFVRNYRLNQAARLLRENPSLQIAQIAYEVGFAHPTNFSTTFKKHFGVSPIEYASAHSRGNEIEN